jgi:hypothetical protein
MEKFDGGIVCERPGNVNWQKRAAEPAERGKLFGHREFTDRMPLPEETLN